jgi:DNA-binding HxlR family transcriptional regulator
MAAPQIALTTSVEERPGCIQSALRILGEKWTALILRDLMGADKTFGDLETGLSGISPRTLSARLDKLEQEKIIEKKLYCSHPPRYEYHLTKKGKELQDILGAMADWGLRHHSEC